MFITQKDPLSKISDDVIACDFWFGPPNEKSWLRLCTLDVSSYPVMKAILFQEAKMPQGWELNQDHAITPDFLLTGDGCFGTNIIRWNLALTAMSECGETQTATQVQDAG